MADVKPFVDAFWHVLESSGGVSLLKVELAARPNCSMV
jgi:hypothetical protein